MVDAGPGSFDGAIDDAGFLRESAGLRSRCVGTPPEQETSRVTGGTAPSFLANLPLANNLSGDPCSRFDVSYVPGLYPHLLNAEMQQVPGRAH